MSREFHLAQKPSPLGGGGLGEVLNARVDAPLSRRSPTPNPSPPGRGKRWREADYSPGAVAVTRRAMSRLAPSSLTETHGGRGAR